MNNIIRVFPRRTKWTPTDDLVLVGEPPLFELPDLPVYISSTFTWDITEGNRLFNIWSKQCRNVLIGGPAFGDLGSEFVPGRFIKEGVTITSRGCPKNCPWCLVHKREGRLREINIADGYIVQDNNLLACSRGHIEKVFEMLSRQKKAAQFKGGLDIDYLEQWHVELLKKIRVDEIWVACDTKQDLVRLDKAADLLADFPLNKIRCYALIGFNGENPDEADRRCEAIYKKGFLPFAQFYIPPDRKRLPVNNDWHFITWKWSRPAAYRSNK
jgi:hypothetical protein